MKASKFGVTLGFLLIIAAIIIVGQLRAPLAVPESEEKGILGPYESAPGQLHNVKLEDNKNLYAADNAAGMDVLYVTVLPPSVPGAVTFSTLNSVYNTSVDGLDFADTTDPIAEVVFSTSRTGTATNTANATMEIRGQSARNEPQKSYKIKLYDSAETWLGFSTINLNKHYDDRTRIANKLSFDYFQMLDDMVSMRTRFVQLYIKDLSAAPPDRDFKPYGLYTFIETPNRHFLATHGLDPNGHLYKAEYFEFFRYEEALKLTSDPTYVAEKFERYLETRGSTDHGKLLAMLDDLNNYSLDVDEVINKHFDRDNLLTWLAINVLTGNYDTAGRNFFLYSPLNSAKWFLLPWDYDKAWVDDDEYSANWESGIANYWGMVLFERFLKVPSNVVLLSAKIDELCEVMNAENTKILLDRYYESVSKTVLVQPDLGYLRLSPEQYEHEYYALAIAPERNKERYYAKLENPLPFYLGEPVIANNKLTLEWSPSYDLQGDELAYDLIISKEPEFGMTVAHYQGLTTTNHTIDLLPTGQYFWKVLAIDSKGNSQYSFDRYYDGEDELFGLRSLVID